MNALAVAAIAAGELICAIPDRPNAEAVLIYDVRADGPPGVIDSRRVGRRPVAIRADDGGLHLIEDDGQSVRVTTLTECTRTKLRGTAETCTRFAAQHAWHFDPLARRDPAASLVRQPSGAASGSCEPWRVD
jgi:hypothetical protein